MVHLVLVSSKGNGVRFWPYSGYLGLTPLKVEGAVCTKLDSDQKTLQAKSITVSVRCYESRLGRLGALQTNLLVEYTQTLWSKPDGQDSDAVGDGEYPFRITVPAKVAGFSTVSLVEYKCVWRVEAVLNHIPIAGVGSRQLKYVELPLLRYDVPPNLPSPQHSMINVEPKLDRQTSKPRGPRISYWIDAPKAPIGPTDLVSIPVHILPQDPNVSVRSATLIVERRIILNDTSNSALAQSPSQPRSPPNVNSLYHTSSSAPASSSIPRHNFTSSSTSLVSESTVTSYHNDSASTNSSNNTITSTTALLPSGRGNPNPSHSSDSLTARPIVNIIAGAESSGPFTRSSTGVSNKTLTFQWPSVKSIGRWGIGETIHSDLAFVKYYVRVKVIITSSSGTDSLDLEEQELLIVSTNAAERRLALAKYEQDHPRSKSKSPRRTARSGAREGTPDVPLPSPASTATKSNQNVNGLPSIPVKGKGKASSRRPHTSAGPRDKPSRLTGGSSSRSDGLYGRATHEALNRSDEDEDEDVPYRRKLRPGSSSTSTAAEITKHSAVGYLYSPPATAVGYMYSPPSTATSTPRTRAFTQSDATSASSGAELSTNIRDSANIREWEEELARIEAQSRQSSDLLGFGLKRKRPSFRQLLFAGKA